VGKGEFGGEREGKKGGADDQSRSMFDVLGATKFL